MAKKYSFDVGKPAYIEIRAKTTECRLSSQILKRMELRSTKLTVDEDIVGRVNVDTSNFYDEETAIVKLKINDKVYQHKFTI